MYSKYRKKGILRGSLSISFKFIVLFSILICASCKKDDKFVVVCWGDSLTAPIGEEHGVKGMIKDFLGKPKSYPFRLASLLGEEYEVINAGVAGENTLAIMARQGAYPMKLAHDVTVFKNSKSKHDIVIGSTDIPAFVSSYNDEKVTPLLQLGWNEDSPAKVNPCIIGGEYYNLKSCSDFWKEDNRFVFDYTYSISPLNNSDSSFVIKKGSIVHTYAMKHLRNKYANVFFIGENGGFCDVADLIKQLKAMIAYSNSSKYVIVSFHKPNRIIPTVPRMKEMEDSLSMEFGKHFINLREYMVTEGYKQENITPTKEDLDSIQKGQVPPQLLVDGLHFSGVGYKIIARVVYDKMKELGY